MVANSPLFAKSVGNSLRRSSMAMSSLGPPGNVIASSLVATSVSKTVGSISVSWKFKNSYSNSTSTINLCNHKVSKDIISIC